jgi:integrase
MGWVEKRRNGWVARYRVDGKVKSKYFDDEREARYYARMGKPIPVTSSQIIDRLQESMGNPRKGRTPKLAEYASKLIASDPNIREGTRDGYEHILRNHLEGTALGGMAISAITPADVREFWAGIKPKKSGPAGGRGVQANCYQLLAKALHQAINDGLIQNSPLSRSGIRRPPKRMSTEVVPMSVDDIERLAAATTNERDRLMVLLAGYVGLRAGEVGGLRVRDLDAARCRITVAQAVVRNRSGRRRVLPNRFARDTGTRRCLSPRTSRGRVHAW